MSTSTPPLRFLVVEDEALLAMDIGSMIEDAGHVVVAEAASLQEVEAVTPSIDPQIAFVDVQLAGGSSGLDVCAHIQKCWAGAVIVFLTANPKKVLPDFAGAHAVMSKPFSRSGLISAMRYLEEGLHNRPPSAAKPAELIAAPKLAILFAGETTGSQTLR